MGCLLAPELCFHRRYITVGCGLLAPPSPPPRACIFIDFLVYIREVHLLSGCYHCGSGWKVGISYLPEMNQNDKHTLQASLFGTVPPNSALTGYATEGTLLTSARLSTDSVSALRQAWILTKHFATQTC